jgi:hypothetical protein
MKEDKS